MKNIITRLVLPVIIGLLIIWAFAGATRAYAYEVTGILVDEFERDNVRVCIYETPYGEYVMSVPWYKYCPVTVRVQR